VGMLPVAQGSSAIELERLAPLGGDVAIKDVS